MISFHSSLAPWEVRVLSCQVLFDLVRADRGTNKTYISYPLAFRSMRSSTKSELAYLMSKSWNRHGAKIWNVYGLSQTTVHWFIDQPAIYIYISMLSRDRLGHELPLALQSIFLLTSGRDHQIGLHPIFTGLQPFFEKLIPKFWVTTYSVGPHVVW